jgi:hypothetical protein
MKMLVLAALATSAVAIAAPALAHDRDDDWTVASYDAFAQQYRHIWDGIQHGVSDGSYTPREAQYFYRQLRSIQARADWEDRTGRFDSDEINDRLESLHDRMHVAHERGHERLESGDYGNGYGYGRQPYSYGGAYGYDYGRRR